MDRYIKVAVIGLGNVGINVALCFSKVYDTIGFDINNDLIIKLNNNTSLSATNKPERLIFSDNIGELNKCNFFIITVPTMAIDGRPNLQSLKCASQSVGTVLKKNDVVVYESTVYPGATEKLCIPILEKFSGLTSKKDFKVGYSPERFNLGDEHHNFTKVTKIVSGQDQEALDIISKVYEFLIDVGVYRASNIKTAEAAKLVENIQRDVNIALINEIAAILKTLKIDTSEVLAAARSKWNFSDFKPGLVGGNCLNTASQLFSYSASKSRQYPILINTARNINNSFSDYISDVILNYLSGAINNSLVTVLGITYKADFNDVRYSLTKNIVNKLKHHNVSIQLHDPVANNNDAINEYGLPLIDIDDLKPASVLLFTVEHKQFNHLAVSTLKKLMNDKALLVDIPSIYSKKLLLDNGINLWQL